MSFSPARLPSHGLPSDGRLAATSKSRVPSSSVNRAACIAGGAWTSTFIGAFTGIDVPFHFFTFHFSLFTFHFSLFAFHFSLFAFHFSLFAVLFSLVACRFSAVTNGKRQGTGIGFLLLNVPVAAAPQLERIALAPSLACSLADDVIFNIMTSQLLASLLGDVIFIGAPAA